MDSMHPLKGFSFAMDSRNLPWLVVELSDSSIAVDLQYQGLQPFVATFQVDFASAGGKFDLICQPSGFCPRWSAAAAADDLPSEQSAP